jgi:hypothetical protein
MAGRYNPRGVTPARQIVSAWLPRICGTGLSQSFDEVDGHFVTFSYYRQSMVSDWSDSRYHQAACRNDPSHCPNWG